MIASYAYADNVVRPDLGVFSGRPPLLAVHDLDMIGLDADAQAAAFAKRVATFLRTVRLLRLPVAHILSSNRSIAAWPDGCRPLTSEMVFERRVLSCLASEPFTAAVERFRDAGVIFCGCRSATALASIVDGRALGARAFALTDLLYETDQGDDFAAPNESAIQFIRNSGAELTSARWPYDRSIG